MPRQSRQGRLALTFAYALSAFLLAGGASVAHADLLGGDVAVLTSIFHTSLKQLDELRSVTDTLAKSYSTLEELARDASNTKKAFQDFQRLDGNRTMTSGARAMNGAFPGVAFLQGNLKSAKAAPGGTGRLPLELRSCIESLARSPGSETAECDQLKRDATSEQLAASLGKTFGTVPPGRSELAEARKESVTAEEYHLLGEAKRALVGVDAADMLTRCKGATESVVCQRLAAEATIKGYEQQAEANKELDDLFLAQATAAELHVADARRALIEERARRTALVTGLPPGTATGLTPAP